MSICQKTEGVQRCNGKQELFHLNLCISANWMEMGNLIFFFFFCKFSLFPNRNNKGQIPVRGRLFCSSLPLTSTLLYDREAFGCLVLFPVLDGSALFAHTYFLVQIQ